MIFLSGDIVPSPQQHCMPSKTPEHPRNGETSAATWPCVTSGVTPTVFAASPQASINCSGLVPAKISLLARKIKRLFSQARMSELNGTSVYTRTELYA